VSTNRMESFSTRSEQDRLYQEAASQLGPALERLAMAYEADSNVREDSCRISISLFGGASPVSMAGVPSEPGFIA
jgi:hypothetical protein